MEKDLMTNCIRPFSFYSFNQRITIDQHKIGKEPIVTDYEIILFI